MDEMDQNEELYRAWIGEKNQDEYYNKMKNGGFNWVAFFLFDLLMLTRKMYLESVIYLVVAFLFAITCTILGVPKIISNILNIGISITIGFTYYYIYRWSISRKIKKYQKRGLTYEKQLEIARKKGGDKITISVIFMFIAECILVLLLMNITVLVVYFTLT